MEIKKIVYIIRNIVLCLIACILSFIVSMFLYLALNSIFLFAIIIFIFYLIKLVKNKKWSVAIFTILNFISMLIGIIIAGNVVQGI